jgi:hypothetical protein
VRLFAAVDGQVSRLDRPMLFILPFDKAYGGQADPGDGPSWAWIDVEPCDDDPAEDDVIGGEPVEVEVL